MDDPSTPSTPGSPANDGAVDGTAAGPAGSPVDGVADGPAGGVRVHAALVARVEQLRTVVTEARSMPMSASAVVNRKEVLALVDEIAGALGSAFAGSTQVVAEREAVLAEARAQAGRIVADAQGERDRLVGGQDVHRLAADEAERLVGEARSEADELRRETDDYVDARLAHFEITLERTSEAVKRGRARLAGRSDLSGITAEEADRIALPEHLDD